MIARFTLLCSLLTLLVGCGGWSDDSEWTTGVWSENDTQVAFVLDRFESRDPLWSINGADTRRNHSLQVHVASAQAGQTPQPLGPIFDNSTVSGTGFLHYMENAGYALLTRRVGERTEDSSGSSFATVSIERIGLDGSHRQVARANGVSMLSCDGGSSSTQMPLPVFALPSPDGTLIALVESNVDCTTQRSEVRFLRGSDLSLAAGPFGFADGSTPDSPTQFAWTPDGNTLLMGFWGFGGVYGQAMTTTGTISNYSGFDHACFYPATSSDFGDGSGRGVSVNAANTVEFIDGMWSDGTLGCP